jgi:hypothetical protein
MIQKQYCFGDCEIIVTLNNSSKQIADLWTKVSLWAEYRYQEEIA